MRTTLELDDDILATAKELAQQQGTTVGQVVSELARRALAANHTADMRNGARLFALRTASATPDLHLVNTLRDDD